MKRLLRYASIAAIAGVAFSVTISAARAEPLAFDPPGGSENCMAGSFCLAAGVPYGFVPDDLPAQYRIPDDSARAGFAGGDPGLDYAGAFAAPNHASRFRSSRQDRDALSHPTSDDRDYGDAVDGIESSRRPEPGTDVSPVPEPASALLLAAGLAVLGWRRLHRPKPT